MDWSQRRGTAQLKRLADAIEDDATALPEGVRDLGQMYLAQIAGLNARAGCWLSDSGFTRGLVCDSLSAWQIWGIWMGRPHPVERRARSRLRCGRALASVDGDPVPGFGEARQ